MGSPVLAVLTSVPVGRAADGLLLDSKALEGMRRYAAGWPGTVRWLASATDEPMTYAERHRSADLPFEVRTVANDRSDLGAALDGATLLLASGDNHRDLELSGRIRAPLVYVIEYSFRTRLQILRVSNRWIHRKGRSLLWEAATERVRRRAFAQARGLQANGVPAFRRYGALTPASLLYFDTRLSATQQIDVAGLAAKARAIAAGGPLRLAYSGRLERMKGADCLVPVAIALARRGVDFTLDIFGEGSLAGSMRSTVARAGLSSRVTLHGAVSFADDLVPRLKSGIDLFLCCHPQGDPSCTYLETLGCGVPIAGFRNEALAGLMDYGAFAVARRVGDVEGLADEVAALDDDRPRLRAMAEVASGFAAGHPFEQVFASRIAHLRGIAQV